MFNILLEIIHYIKFSGKIKFKKENDVYPEEVIKKKENQLFHNTK